MIKTIVAIMVIMVLFVVIVVIMVIIFAVVIMVIKSCSLVLNIPTSLHCLYLRAGGHYVF